MSRMSDFEELQVRLPDGYDAYARYWGQDEPRGAVLYHHGIQSHCGWYETSPTRLAEAGYAVLQIDRRGCGRNQKDRGHAESAEQLIGDAGAARDELFRRSGLNEYHVVGVSWGGKLVVAAYVADPVGVKSLSLVTPGLFPLVGVSKETASQIGFAMIYERQKPFDIPLNDADRFTADPKWQEFFRTDELTMKQCTAGFYLASRRMDKLAAKLPESEPIPIHLMVAGDERIVDNAKTVAFIQDLNWPGTQVSEHPNSRHSLEFEEESETYLTQLVSFVGGLSS
ncbi:MAG: alpha/beta fold hydrolase [Planctomycetes bacterium]|nr:alpha/beta fold hydrolase [Planctomycetota bacterium]